MRTNEIAECSLRIAYFNSRNRKGISKKHYNSLNRSLRNHKVTVLYIECMIIMVIIILHGTVQWT